VISFIPVIPLYRKAGRRILFKLKYVLVPDTNCYKLLPLNSYGRFSLVHKQRPTYPDALRPSSDAVLHMNLIECK